MKKFIYFSVFFVFLFFAFTSSVQASLLVIKSNGSLEWKVLSAEDETSLSVPKHASLGIEKVGNSTTNTKSTIKLSKTGDDLNLAVTTGDKTNDLNVTDWKENLVEIEEKPEVQKIAIGIRYGKFSLMQKGVMAVTDFPLIINSQTSELSVKTETGEKYLSILPFEAVQSFLRTKWVNHVDQDQVQILEHKGDLAYKVPGERIIDFFGIYSYSIPISSYISASTGAVLSIDGPKWLNAINFLFS